MDGIIYRLDFDCGDGRMYHYWGSSVNFKQRIGDHRKGLRKGKHPNQRMQRTFDKYGDFRATVVMLCGRESLEENERCMIARHYRRDYCLNLTVETVSPLRDPEIKARAEEALRAAMMTEEWKRNNKAKNQRLAKCPSWRAKNKAARERLRSDPEFQAAHAAATRAAHNKAVELTLPSGEVCAFPSVNAAAKEIAVRQPTLSMWLLGRNPWPGQGGRRPVQKLAHLEGLTGRYIE